MKIADVLERCKEIKKERKETYFNYYNKYNSGDVDFDVIEGKGTILFALQEEFVYRVFFCSNDLFELRNCLRKVRKGAVIDWIFKGEDIGEIGETIESSGWKTYQTYARTTLPIPYKKKKTRMELLLEKMYNPNLAILAVEDDVVAIRKLMLDEFDPLCSEVMGEEELRKLIKDEMVWLYKVNDKIATLYIYRIEGKKRYGAMTYNCLSADYLYSITHKANEVSNKKHDPKWHYGWINLANKKIINTLDKTGDLALDGLRNVIYRKE